MLAALHSSHSLAKGSRAQVTSSTLAQPLKAQEAEALCRTKLGGMQTRGANNGRTVWPRADGLRSAGRG